MLTSQPVFAGTMPKEITPGQWRTVEYMTDYRIERLSDLLVERVTWNEDAPTKTIYDAVVAAPGYIWFRFWLLKTEHVVEKYFADDGHVVGIYAPVCLPFLGGEHGLKTSDLILGLWMADGNVVVLNEDEYDAAVASAVIAPEEAIEAELRIRAMTLATAQQTFPPAIIRNFELDLGRPE